MKMNREQQSLLLSQAQKLIENDERDEAKFILLELEKYNNTEAIYLLSTYLGYEDENGVVHDDKKWIDYLLKAAEANHPEALYFLGYQYDIGGEFPCDARDIFPKDKEKAAQLFKKAASFGHPHSTWIHGMDLLYGTNGIVKNEKEGIKYITKAANLGSENAIATMVELYEKAAFGFPNDKEMATTWRNKLDKEFWDIEFDNGYIY